MERTRIISALLGALALAFVLLPAEQAGGQAPPIEDQLNEAVANGRLDAEIRDAVLAGDAVDALVILDQRDVVDRVHADARARGLETSDPTVIQTLAAELATLKGRNLPSGLDVISDYENFPIRAIRFQSAATLVSVLRAPMVEAIRADKQNERQLGRSLPLINQPAAQLSGYAGAGTSVAVIDSGVDYLYPSFGCTGVNLPTNTCRVPFSTDFAPNDQVPDDAGRHGTNVSAIVLGVAPSTKILGLNVFHGETASDTVILEALNWVVTNRATYNIVAANLSLGSTSWFASQCTGSVYAPPFTNLRSVGVLPVVAAGNGARDLGYFKNGLSEPACAPGAISAGAVYDASFGPYDCGSSTYADKITCYSQSASYLSLLAPGDEITAGGASMGGTSMAAPHVAGAVAVLASAAPASTVVQRETALTSAGPPITDARNGVTKRRLDVCWALHLVSRPCSPGPSNDHRANATRIAANRALLTHSNYGFTTEPADPVLSCGASGSQQSASAWYKFTTSSLGTLAAKTTGSNVPALDYHWLDETVLALFEASGGSLIPLACNDDIGDGTFASQISYALQAGKTYYLEVTGWGSDGAAGGYVVLNVTYTGSISPDGATKLGFTATPSGGEVGVAFPTQPVVAVQDPDGATVSSGPVRSVVLSKATGPGTLTCTGGLTKNTVNGVATFSGCSVSAPGVYTLRATSSGLTTATSTSFTVTAVPIIGWLDPPSRKAGGSGFILNVKGSYFVSGSVIRWNGVDRSTVYVNSTTLASSVASAEILNEGPITVTVFTPGVGESNAVVFLVYDTSMVLPGLAKD